MPSTDRSVRDILFLVASTPEQRKRWREKAAKRYAANPDRYARKYQEKRDAILDGQHSRGLPCRKCRTPRAVAVRDRERLIALGGPLCHPCRRAEKARVDAELAEIRDTRLSKRPASLPRHPARGSGRSGTGNARYRRNRLAILVASDVCGICGHGGSATVDHIVSAKRWPKGENGKPLPSFDDIENMQPAHGTMGATGMTNPCPTCGRLCNQAKGSR